MTALQALIEIGPELRETELWLRKYYEEISNLGEIFFGKNRSAKSRQNLLLERYDDWERQLTELVAEATDPRRIFLEEARRFTDEQFEGLFHCFINPHIPGTNNGTEQLIKRLKSDERTQSKMPNPGERFINNAPISALFITQENVPDEAFIASRTREEMTQARTALKQTRHRTGVARLARSDLPKLLDRVKKRWALRSAPPPPPTNMDQKQITTS